MGREQLYLQDLLCFNVGAKQLGTCSGAGIVLALFTVIIFLLFLPTLPVVFLAVALVCGTVAAPVLTTLSQAVLLLCCLCTLACNCKSGQPSPVDCWSGTKELLPSAQAVGQFGHVVWHAQVPPGDLILNHHCLARGGGCPSFL